MSLIRKLRSQGLIVNDENIEKIEQELDYLGYYKFKELITLKRDIQNIINIYKYDCKIATFFWRHIRRIETNFKSLLINYFENENNPRFIINGRLDEEFAEKYLKFSRVKEDYKTNNRKTLNVAKRIIRKNKKKGVSVFICQILSRISLGNLLDLFDRIDSSKFTLYEELKQYRELSKLVALRNKIAHHKLLITKYNEEDFVDFWKTIKKQSLTTAKTITNEEDLMNLLKNVYNIIRVT